MVTSLGLEGDAMEDHIDTRTGFLVATVSQKGYLISETGTGDRR